MGAAGELGGGEMGSCYLTGTEFQFCKMKIFLRMDHGDDTRKKPNEYTKCHQTEYLKIVKLVKFMS